jgi:pimeloyl-ACP methyl ester carboxylesterase
MKSAQIQGLTINYSETNCSLEKTIVFLHGNSHGHRTFTRQLNAYELSDYRLIAIDLPGHGDSSASENYTLSFLGSVVSDFIQTLDLKNIILVGHSLGGHVAINAATEVGPQAIFLFGTPPLQKPFEVSSFLPNQNGAALMKPESTTEEIEALINELKYSGEEKIQAIKDYLKTDPNFRVKVFQSVAMNEHIDEVAILNEYTGKLMIMISVNESIINNQYILDKSNLRKIPPMLVSVSAGHSPHIENSKEFNSHLATFCKNVFAGSSAETITEYPKTNKEINQIFSESHT